MIMFNGAPYKAKADGADHSSNDHSVWESARLEAFLGWPGKCAPGLLLTTTIALASLFISDRYGGPVMLYALLFGLAFNFLSTDPRFVSGITTSVKQILRISVALLGARITIEEVTSLGASVALQCNAYPQYLFYRGCNPR